MRWTWIALAAVAAFVLYVIYKRRQNDAAPTYEVWSGDVSTKATLDQFAHAITDSEGKPGDLNYRNNNPGNLVQNGVFAKFATWADGWNALLSDLGAKVRKYPNYTLLQICVRYLGGDPSNIPADGEIYANGKLQGNAKDKAAFLASRMGVDVNDTLSEIFG